MNKKRNKWVNLSLKKRNKWIFSWLDTELVVFLYRFKRYGYA